MNVIQSGGGGSAKKWQKYVDVGIGGNGRQTMVMKANSVKDAENDNWRRVETRRGCSSGYMMAEEVTTLQL